MKSISRRHNTTLVGSVQWNSALEALGKLRLQTLRRAFSFMTGLTVAGLMLREVVLLMALPGGVGDVLKIPILLLISLFHYTFASFLGLFPLALPLIACRSRHLGALAALMLGPAALFGVPWLPEVGFDLPASGTLALMAWASGASLFAGLEVHSQWRSTRRLRRRGAVPFDWKDHSLLSASLLVAWVVWLWSCLPLPGTS